MNEKSNEILKPFQILRKRAEEIAIERGFKILNFGIDPTGEDDRPRVQLVLEYDPENEHKPQIVMLQVDQAMNDQLEESAKQRLAEEVAEARRNLQKDAEARDPQAQADLEKKLKGRGGFLD